MNADVKEIQINGITYVLKNENETAKNLEGLEYVIARTYSAGVFAGYLKTRNGKEGELIKARRLWSWAGAASLSQMAMDGTSAPEKCKFPCEVTSIILTEIIEIIPCTKKAQRSIKGVKIWEV